MRSKLFASCFVALCLGLVLVSASFAADVYPTGDVTLDAANIQAAIEAASPGDTITLKATRQSDGQYVAFNFGAPGATAGYVRITKEGVKIVGAKLPNAPLGKDWDSSNVIYNQDFDTPVGKIKSDRAMIWGGGRGATSTTPSYAVVTTLPSDLYSFSIEGLRFENFGYSAFWANASGANGITVKDNVITNVIPLFELVTHPQRRGMGITFQNFSDAPTFNGNITIESNLIDFVGDSGDANNTFSLYFAIGVGHVKNPISAVISNNTLKNCPNYGITATANSYSLDLKIADNFVKERTYPNWKTGSYPIYCSPLPGTIHILDNIVSGESPAGYNNYGILLQNLGDKSEIKRNHIQYDNASYGLAFGLAAGMVSAQGNIIKGNNMNIGMLSHQNWQSTNTIIKENTIEASFRVNGKGLLTGGNKFVTIENNIVRNTAAVPGTGFVGLAIASISSSDPTPEGNVIRGNTVSGNGQYAIGIGGPQPWSYIARNNTFEANDTSGFTPYSGYQFWVGLKAQGNNTITGNTFGVSSDTTNRGITIEGISNLVKDNYYGSAPTAISLTSASRGNIVNEPNLCCPRIIDNNITLPLNIITCNSAPIISSLGNKIVTVGVAVSNLQIVSSSDPGQTLKYAAANLPPGLSIDSSNGLVSGTPTSGGTTYEVTVTVDDQIGCTNSTASTTVDIYVRTPQDALNELRARVETYNAKKGILQSLDAKLNNVLASLNAANADQRNDAINKLQAFINECQAQGANELIPYAQEIITSLQAGY